MGKWVVQGCVVVYGLGVGWRVWSQSFRLPAGLEVVERMHSSGLRVYLVHIPHVRVVRVGVLVRAGLSSDSLAGVPVGTASLMRFLFWSGTNRWGVTSPSSFMGARDLVMSESPYANLEVWNRFYDVLLPQEVDQSFQLLGASEVYSTVDQEVSMFSVEVPAVSSLLALEMLLKLWWSGNYSRLPEALQVQYQGLNRLQTDEVAYFQERFLYHFFRGHPYGVDVHRVVKAMPTYTLKHVYRFVERAYIPQNTVVYLIGGFPREWLRDSRAVFQVIDRVFQEETPSGGRRSGSQQPGFPEMPAFSPDWQGERVVREKWATYAMGMWGMVAAPLLSDEAPAYYLLAYLLNNDAYAGLLDSLMIAGSVTSAYAHYIPLSRSGVFAIFFVPQEPYGEKSLNSAYQIVRDVLELVAEGRFSRERFAWAYRQLLSDFQRDLTDPSSLEYILSEVALGHGWEQYQQFLQKLSGLNEEAVRRVAKRLLEVPSLRYYAVDASSSGVPLDLEGVAPPSVAIPLAQTMFSEEALGYLQRAEEVVDRLSRRPDLRDPGFQVDTIRLDSVPVLFKAGNSPDGNAHIHFLFPYGTLDNPWLPLLADAWNSAGADTLSPEAFQRWLAQHQCVVQFSADDLGFHVEVTAPPEEVSACLIAFRAVFFSPVLGPDVFTYLQEEEKARRAKEERSMGVLADAALQFVLYGEYSRYRYRPADDQLQYLSPHLLALYRDSILASFPFILVWGEVDGRALLQWMRTSFYPKRFQWRLPVLRARKVLVPQSTPALFYYRAKNDTAYLAVYFQPVQYKREYVPVLRAHEVFFNLLFQRFSVYPPECQYTEPMWSASPAYCLCELMVPAVEVSEAWTQISRLIQEPSYLTELLRWARVTAALAQAMVPADPEEAVWYAFRSWVYSGSLAMDIRIDTLQLNTLRGWHQRRVQEGAYQLILVAPENPFSDLLDREVIPLTREFLFTR